MEGMNAESMHMGLPQGERLKRLNQIAIRQMQVLTSSNLIRRSRNQIIVENMFVACVRDTESSARNEGKINSCSSVVSAFARSSGATGKFSAPASPAFI
jgi:hypothetical protein